MIEHASDVKVMADGIILVADAGGRSVSAFDRSGRLINRIGRSGSGPGEFSGIDRIFPIGRDSLFVPDHDRGTLFRISDGAVLETIRFDPGHGTTVMWAVGRAGTIVRVTYSVQTGQSFFGDNSRLAMWIHTYAGFRRIPLPKDLHLRLPSAIYDAPGLVAMVGIEEIAVADPNRFEIQLLSLSGEPRERLGMYDYRPLEVSESDKEYLRGRTFTELSSRLVARLEERTNSVVAERLMSRFAEHATNSQIRVADYYPAFTDLLVDDIGRFWLRKPAHADELATARSFELRWDDAKRGTFQWDVYAQSGSHVARVNVPFGFVPTDVLDGFVYGYQITAEHERIVMRAELPNLEGGH